MGKGRLRPVLEHVQRLAGVPAVRSLTDRELLARFAAGREEAAFAELVRRHAGLVWGVCRRVLGHEQDAEDAFQAVFVVLARKAGSVRWRDTAAGWLHEAARRLAAEARTRAARRRRHDRELRTMPPRESAPEPAAAELHAVLDEELQRLPPRFREPLLLCYLEGRTRDQAARRLGWSLRTLDRRLGQGRELLRARLTRRGVALSTALLVAGLTQEAATATPPALTTAAAVKAVLAGTVSADVAALAEAGLAGLAAKKTTAALVLAVTLLTAGAGLLACQGGATKPAEERAELPPKVARAEDALPPQEQQVRTDRHGDPLPPRALTRMGTTRFRHGARISSIALAPDGRTLASTGDDKTVRVWESATGRELLCLPTSEQEPSCLAYSPDGVFLASSYRGYEGISVRDAQTGQLVRRLQNPRYWFGAVRFSPDGEVLAAAGDKHRIALWDALTGQFLRTLDGQEKSNSPAIAFSPDGRTLASGRLDMTIQLWDVATGKALHRLRIPASPGRRENRSPRQENLILDLAFSPDGKALPSCGLAQDNHLWDPVTGKELRRVPGGEFGTSRLAFSPDGRLLASGEPGAGVLRLWETATGRELRQFSVPPRWVTGLAFSGDGQTLLASVDVAIHRWNVQTGEEALPDRGHSAAIHYASLLPDQRTLLTASIDGTIRQWDPSTGEESDRAVTIPTFDATGDEMAVSPDGRVVACSKREKVAEDQVEVGVRLWDRTARKDIAVLWRPNLHPLAFSPDGRTLFTHGWDVKDRVGVLTSWDAATGKERAAMARQANLSTFGASTALSPDGRLLAALERGPAPTIHVWETASGKELRRLPWRREFLNCDLAFCPNNRLLAVVDGPPVARPVGDPGFEHRIHVWDVGTGKQVREFGLSSEGHWPVAFSPDGRTLATADERSRIRLWELATGGERLALEGHTGWVRKLLFAEHGRTLLSTSNDTTVLRWDLTGLRTQAAGKLEQAAGGPEDRWDALGSDHAAKAYEALWALTTTPDRTVALLKKHLPPARPDEQAIARLVADLDSPALAVREKAAAELARLGSSAEPALRKALAGQPSAELRERIQKLLDRLDAVPTGDDLRALRAVELLEQLATPEARRLLEDLARGAAGDPLTREARESLERLSRRPAAEETSRRPSP